MATRDELSSAWVEFLTRNNFTIFGNLTFAEKMGPSTCKKRVNKFLKELSKQFQCEPFVFIAQEMQKRCQVHYHLLIDARASCYIDPFIIQSFWEYGYSRFYTINNDFNALKYVAKYVITDGGYYNDWWIWDARDLPGQGELSISKRLKPKL
jgi:hypothetical protein